MAKEQFTYAASKSIVTLFERASDQAGLSRGQVFEDFLTFTRCALAGQTMEEEYLETVAKGYAKGKKGQRAIDNIVEAFAELVNAMSDPKSEKVDILGDIFTGAITYGERGQFFTPDPVCDLMAAMTVPTERTEEPQTVNDPACGSGRTLLNVANHQPHWEFVGQDIDHRCAQMTAINLGLHNLNGWAVWQNTLTLECHRVYRTGLNWRTGGVITEAPVERSPFSDVAMTRKPETGKMPKPVNEEVAEVNKDSDLINPPSQLELF